MGTAALLGISAGIGARLSSKVSHALDVAELYVIEKIDSVSKYIPGHETIERFGEWQDRHIFGRPEGYAEMYKKNLRNRVENKEKE